MCTCPTQTAAGEREGLHCSPGWLAIPWLTGSWVTSHSAVASLLPILPKPTGELFGVSWEQAILLL